MSALVDTPYSERLAALGYRPGDVLERGACGTCAVPMERRVNGRGDDSHWHLLAEPERVDPWERLDALLEAGDVAAYSAAKAHRVLLGSWPWDHNHLAEGVEPVPANH